MLVKKFYTLVFSVALLVFAFLAGCTDTTYFIGTGGDINFADLNLSGVHTIDWNGINFVNLGDVNAHYFWGDGNFGTGGGGVDTNWQTGWGVFDANVKTQYKLTGANTLHTHSYLPLSGGTLTGDTTVSGARLKVWNGTEDVWTFAVADWEIPANLNFVVNTEGKVILYNYREAVNIFEVHNWEDEALTAYFMSDGTLHLVHSLYLDEGTNRGMGLATLVGGTAEITTNKVSANTRIFLTVQTAGGTQGFLSTTRSAGSHFHINSTSATETSTVAWLLIEPD